MKKLLATTILLAFLLMTTASVWAVPEQWKLVVRVSGKVENQLQSQGPWHMIWQSRMLKDGDRARTGPKSRANIKLSDQSLITLGENTEVELSQFKVSNESRTASVKLFFGKVRSRVGRFAGKDSKFEVKTPNAVLAARGTDFFVEYKASAAQSGSDAGSTDLIVFESSVDVTANGQTTTIPAGSTATVNADGTVVVNPTNLQPQAPGATKGASDGDLIEYEPEGADGTASEIPPDPSASGSGAPGSSNDATQNPAGVIPPSEATTGTVNVIIHLPSTP